MDPKQLHFSRRKFMQGAAMIGAVPLVPNHGFSTSDSDKAPPQSAEGTVPKKSLGRTGVQVSALGLGGYHRLPFVRAAVLGQLCVKPNFNTVALVQGGQRRVS